jgi:hypothetical protein
MRRPVQIGCLVSFDGPDTADLPLGSELPLDMVVNTINVVQAKRLIALVNQLVDQEVANARTEEMERCLDIVCDEMDAATTRDRILAEKSPPQTLSFDWALSQVKRHQRQFQFELVAEQASYKERELYLVEADGKKLPPAAFLLLAIDKVNMANSRLEAVNAIVYALEHPPLPHVVPEGK